MNRSFFIVNINMLFKQPAGLQRGAPAGSFQKIIKTKINPIKNQGTNVN